MNLLRGEGVSDALAALTLGDGVTVSVHRGPAHEPWLAKETPEGCEASPTAAVNWGMRLDDGHRVVGGLLPAAAATARVSVGGEDVPVEVAPEAWLAVVPLHTEARSTALSEDGTLVSEKVWHPPSADDAPSPALRHTPWRHRLRRRPRRYADYNG
jgi:hypothetical protein